MITCTFEHFIPIHVKNTLNGKDMLAKAIVLISRLPSTQLFLLKKLCIGITAD